MFTRHPVLEHSNAARLRDHVRTVRVYTVCPKLLVATNCLSWPQWDTCEATVTC